jgi:dihydroxyacid dehydratase/phosphogluconate dehydratase
MALAMEFLGLSPLGSVDPPAVDRRKERVAMAAGQLAVRAYRKGLWPNRILTLRGSETRGGALACVPRMLVGRG